MGKIKNLLGNIAALLYFLFIMSWTIMLLFFTPIIIISYIDAIRVSGFSTQNVGIAFIALFGFFIGLSLLVPAFRKIYYIFPWMFPYVKILYFNVIILSVAMMLLNYGYEVQNSARHLLFFILMVCQIIICRILMCFYFSRKKVYYIGDDRNE